MCLYVCITTAKDMNKKIATTSAPRTAYAVSVGLGILSAISSIGYLLWFMITVIFYYRSWLWFYNSDANLQAVLYGRSQPAPIQSQTSLRPNQRVYSRPLYYVNYALTDY